MKDRFLGAGLATGRQPAVAANGMVSSPHPWASALGVEELKKGGNAVDAAITVSAALMVAVPHQCSPGGDSFWLIRPSSGPTVGFNGSGRSGAGADAGVLRRAGRQAVPERDASAVTVPGVVDGWAQVHERYGTRELADLIEPAAVVAERGLPISPYAARQLLSADSLLRRRPETARVFRPQGRPVRVGERLPLPDLAATLRTVARQPRELYEGKLAGDIAAAVLAEGGSLVVSDLAEHRGTWTAPMDTKYGDWQIEECGPNSQGWLALVALALLDRSAPKTRIDRIHISIEAAKIIAVIRDEFLADLDRMSIDPAAFLTDEWIGRASSWISQDRVASVADLQRLAGAGDYGPRASRGDTAHFAVVDRNGLAVSCIQSLFSDFGTGIVPLRSGFSLQNRGSGFSLVRGHPNELAPRRRPMHTLAPALAVEAGATVAAFGAMGGDAQIQVHLQLLEALRADPDPAAATAAPRWFARRTNGEFEVLVESRLAEQSALVALGHRVTSTAPFDELMGHAQVILVERQGGFLIGAADPRSDGAAIGY